MLAGGSKYIETRDREDLNTFVVLGSPDIQRESRSIQDGEEEGSGSLLDSSSGDEFIDDEGTL